MSHPAIVASQAAATAARLRGLPPDLCAEAAQAAALDALERYDPTRAGPAVFGFRSSVWARADEGRRYDVAARNAPAVAYQTPAVETPEERAAANELLARVRRLLVTVDAADLKLVLDERPLRVMAGEMGVNVSTIWRRREAARERLREAARKVGL